MLKKSYSNIFKIGSSGWIEYNFINDPTKLADFNVTLNPVEFALGLDFHTASKNVAENVSNINENVYIAMSGGIDSEHVANTFYNNKIKFTPVIFTCEDLNELDVWWAFDWCKEHNITPKIVNYTIDQLTKHVTENSLKYRTRPQCGTMAIQILSDLARKNNALLVAGTGDFTYYPDFSMEHMKPHSKAGFSYNDYRVGPEGYYIHLPDLVTGIINNDMPFNFFSWNPEILHSYIKEYDINTSSSDNKIRITGCNKRPKNIGYPDYFFRTNLALRSLNTKLDFKHKEFTEVDYLGTRDQLLKLLKGDNNV